MLSKKVFLTGEPNFSAPPVHAARADVRDTSNHKKASTELRTHLTEACRSGGRQTLSFARFRELLNFRLFRQHRPYPDSCSATIPPLGLLQACHMIHQITPVRRGVRRWI